MTSRQSDRSVASTCSSARSSVCDSARNSAGRSASDPARGSAGRSAGDPARGSAGRSASDPARGSAGSSAGSSAGRSASDPARGSAGHSASDPAAGPGLYVHVPFCLHKCDYCGFYSFPAGPGDQASFWQGINDNLRNLQDFMPEFSCGTSHHAEHDPAAALRTVFIGGGNPTCLGVTHLTQLLDGLQRRLAHADIIEWTVESNPETLTAEVCRALSVLPELRLSIGVQRLCDDDLAFLGRRGCCEVSFQALERAFTITDNVGIDLILGLPTRPMMPSALDNLLRRFPITHLSTYLLSVEPGTPLAGRVAAGTVGDPDDESSDELFMVEEIAAQYGFIHYEIANFARADRLCRHNLNYWLAGDYVGLGPAAVGTWHGVRTQQPAALDEWLAGSGVTREILTPTDRFRERIMLELRLLQRGLDLQRLAADFPQAFAALIPALKHQQKAGNIVLDYNRSHDPSRDPSHASSRASSHASSHWHSCRHENSHQSSPHRATLSTQGISFADSVISDLFAVIP